MIYFYDNPEDFKNNKCLCNIGVAIVGAAAVGAVGTAYAASEASSAQSDAAQDDRGVESARAHGDSVARRLRTLFLDDLSSGEPWPGQLRGCQCLP